MTKAASLAGASGTVVVTDVHSYSGELPTCNIAGLNSDSKIYANGSIYLKGDVSFKNIILETNSAWAYIYAYGKKLTVLENVKTVKGTGIFQNFSIRGGGKNSVVNNGNTEIILNSGDWHFVSVGGRYADIKGNGHITVGEKATINTLMMGNESVESDALLYGSSTLKLVGASANIGTIGDSTDVVGTRYIDATEYTGSISSEWTALDVKVIKAGESVPADAKPGAALDPENEAKAEEKKNQAAASVDYSEYFKVPYKAYDLSGIENLVYLSDSGNDSNNGKTKDKPFKTLEAASTALGEKGGTVAITGTYTYVPRISTKLPNPTNITSTCSTDVFYWQSSNFRTNTTEIYNLNILVGADWMYFLPADTPLTIGDNVTVALYKGVLKYPSIEAERSKAIKKLDVTIKSGTYHNIVAGTYGYDVTGDVNVNISGGTFNNICFGNEGSAGVVKGDINVKLSGEVTVKTISSSKSCKGTATIDIGEYKGAELTIPEDVSIKGEKKKITLNADAVFIDGYPDGTFLPEKKMTRAEAIKVVAVLCGYTENAKISNETAFTDVPASEWYAPYVKYLESFGLLDFYGSKLSPSSEITRGEFTKLVSGLIKDVVAIAPTFPDVSNNHVYYNEIVKAAKAGIVKGNPDGTFNPDGTLKRSEIVTMLNRIIERQPVAEHTAKVQKFSDIKGHWAKATIIAASCQSIQNNLKLWYIGNAYASNSTKDVSKFDYSTTEAILDGIDTNDDAAVEAAIYAYAEKRKEEIANTKTEVTAKSGKKSYYVSADGSDSNDGLSPETAWKTLEKVSGASLKSGDAVYFRRGDTFRGSLTTKYGVIYSAYGEGAKPNLYGSPRDYSESDFWEATDRTNVYVSKEAFNADVGAIFFDDGKYVTKKKAEGINGIALVSDLEMYHNTTDKKIYLYSESDPDTRFTSTEIGVNVNIISGNGTNVTIDNLCIKYTGAYGVSYLTGTSGLTVQNCEFGWIGGRLHTQSNGTITRAGNAIEIYGECNEFTVENCYIYQIYDTGITNQYWGTSENAVCSMKNVKYSDNVIEKCTWNIEYVNGLPNGNMKNVDISGNLLLAAGEGWGSQRLVRSDASIQGWTGESATNNAENFYIYDNVIGTTSEDAVIMNAGAKGPESLPVVTGNIFLGKKGNTFGSYGAVGDQDAKTYNESTADLSYGLENNRFVIAK